MTSKPLKIAIISDSLFPVNLGGAERVYRAMADSFASEGHEVTYITRKQWEPESKPKTPFEIAEIWEGELYDPAGTRKPAAGVRFAFAARQYLKRAGQFDLAVVSATPLLNVLFTQGTLRKQECLLAVDWLEVWPAKKWRSYSGTLVGTVAALLQEFVARLGDVRIAISQMTEIRLQEISFSPQIIRNNLVSLAGPPVECRLETKSKSKTLLFIGRHIPDKNLQTLPCLIRELEPEFPDLKARVVGSGPTTEEVKKLARDLGVAHKIDFLGAVSDEQLELELASSSVLFFPSVREGFGLVVTEAARWGTPAVVVSHVDNAATDLVLDGRNGFVANSLAIGELSDAVRSCFRNINDLTLSTKDWYDSEWRSDGIGRTVSMLVSKTINFRSERSAITKPER